jgi:hypothetical protein
VVAENLHTHRYSLRERLLAVFRGHVPDRVPWFADLSWWHSAATETGELDPRYRDDGVVALHHDLGCGIYLPLCSAWNLTYGCSVQMVREGDCLVRRFTTPVGELREVQRYLPESFTWASTEHLVKSAGDLRALRYIIESQRYEENRGEVKHLLALYGGQGIPVMSVPRTPLSRMFVEFAGVETTIYALYEVPEDIERVFALMEATDVEAYRLAAKAPSPMVMFPDNLSSEVVSPRLFEKYSFAYYERRIEELHAAGKWCLTHIDGTLRGLLPLLARTHLDGVEGLTPFPVGDARPDELRMLTNEEIVLWGGIPGAMFRPGYADERFRNYVIQYLATLRGNPRFVLGVGDQVPPRSDMARVRLVAELVDEFGRY